MWPTYSGGSVAPHATIMPSPGKGVDVRQHTPFSLFARGLVHIAGQPATNTYPYVFQFELVGTCAKGGPGYYWPNADDAVLADLYRKVIEPLNKAFSIPMNAPTWLHYSGNPSSYGNSPVRMSVATFQGWTGWLGHEHVPENLHGDPGLFPWARLVSLITPSVPLEDEMKLVLHTGDNKPFLIRGSEVSEVTDPGMVPVLAAITGQDVTKLPKADGNTLTFIQRQASAPVVDVNALASELAPHLTTSTLDANQVAHLVLAGIKAALPAA